MRRRIEDSIIVWLVLSMFAGATCLYIHLLTLLAHVLL